MKRYELKHSGIRTGTTTLAKRHGTPVNVSETQATNPMTNLRERPLKDRYHLHPWAKPFLARLFNVRYNHIPMID